MPRSSRAGWNLRAVARLDRAFYPEARDAWDEWLLRERVLAALDPGARLLDVGAGRGASPVLDFRGACARVCGIDPDPVVRENPHLHEGRVGSGEAIPYPDAAFEVVLACNVLEHLDDPAALFREVRRVLVPGGRFFAKTPNRWHYVALGASATPHAFHVAYNRLRGRAEVDTFPTRYRANTAPRLRRLAADAGLEVRAIDRVEGRPEYLRWSAALYPLGIAYERLVNASDALAAFRTVLLIELARPPGAAGAPSPPA